MGAFALDKNYPQFNFDEISIEDLEIISGGSGGGTNWLQCGLGTLGGAGLGALAGMAAGSAVPAVGTVAGGIAGGIFGGMAGAAASCFS